MRSIRDRQEVDPVPFFSILAQDQRCETPLAGYRIVRRGIRACLDDPGRDSRACTALVSGGSPLGDLSFGILGGPSKEVAPVFAVSLTAAGLREETSGSPLSDRLSYLPVKLHCKR